MDSFESTAESSFTSNIEDLVTDFDDYGFAVFEEECKFVSNAKVIHNRKKALPDAVLSEWHKVLSDWKLYAKSGSSIKLLNLVKKGVPDELRGKLWQNILETDALIRSSKFNYQEHVEQMRDELCLLGISEFNTTRSERVLNRMTVDECRKYDISESNLLNLKQISLDIGRTFPTHRQFLGNTSEGIEGRAKLFRILVNYTKYNPTIGYCQGMSYIAGMLSMVLPEVEAFWCFVVFLEKPKYLYGYFDNDLEKIQRHAAVFDELLKQKEPELWKHLTVFGVHPLVYVTPWFMCLYTSLPSWDAILSIWDLVLIRGVTVVFETAIAIMISLKNSLLEASDVNQLILNLQNPPVECVQRSVLLPTIFQINVNLWEIESISAVLAEKEKALKLAKSVAPQQMTNSKKFTRYLADIKQKFDRKKTGAKENILVRNLKKAFSIGEKVVVSSLPNFSDHFGNGCQSPLYPLKLSNSTAIDVWRLRRLKMMKGKYNSTDSLGVVNNIIGSSADQRWSFQQFSHQLPLRDIHTPNTSFIASPEKELKSFIGLDGSFSSHDSSFTNKSSN
ncbi:hypothetical protein CHUAL_003861 [Chamberlinius hualienensis]